ncbi:MAG TPA: hypothetical protein VF080_06790 [Solirubrobacteraceae bacterium]
MALPAPLERHPQRARIRRPAHTGLTIPECSCRACLTALVETHAPRPAGNAGAGTPPADGVPADAEPRPQAA